MAQPYRRSSQKGSRCTGPRAVVVSIVNTYSIHPPDLNTISFINNNINSNSSRHRKKGNNLRPPRLRLRLLVKHLQFKGLICSSCLFVFFFACISTLLDVPFSWLFFFKLPPPPPWSFFCSTISNILFVCFHQSIKKKCLVLF